jgi:hypothetical protein
MKKTTEIYLDILTNRAIEVSPFEKLSEDSQLGFLVEFLNSDQSYSADLLEVRSVFIEQLAEAILNEESDKLAQELLIESSDLKKEVEHLLYLKEALKHMERKSLKDQMIEIDEIEKSEAKYISGAIKSIERQALKKEFKKIDSVKSQENYSKNSIKHLIFSTLKIASSIVVLVAAFYFIFEKENNIDDSIIMGNGNIIEKTVQSKIDTNRNDSLKILPDIDPVIKYKLLKNSNEKFGFTQNSHDSVMIKQVFIAQPKNAYNLKLNENGMYELTIYFEYNFELFDSSCFNKDSKSTNEHKNFVLVLKRNDFYYGLKISKQKTILEKIDWELSCENN